MHFKIFYVLTFFLFFSSVSLAQDKNVTLPPNWYNLDLSKDGFFGISTEKAYNDLLKSKTPKKKVVVAVIDGGTDINHEDLKDVLWINKKEIPGNGIDDDGNGYIDDVHGWNFIGSKKGNLQYDNLELVRIIRHLRPKYVSTLPTTQLDSVQKLEYALYLKATDAFGKKYDDAASTMQFLDYIVQLLDTVGKNAGKTVPTLADIEAYKPADNIESQIVSFIKKESKNSKSFDLFVEDMRKAYVDYRAMLQYNLNPTYDMRAELVGDNYLDSSEKFYGNNDVAGPDADHGTHVSGIIGAKRNNNIGINGVADNVEIMSIRVVPTGDERDKDVANGIRYAVDNGADIINMSFGKGFKWDKAAVDAAVKYAEEKGVLLVHAAGNDNENIDEVDNFPNKYYDTPEAIEREHKKLLSKLQPPPMPNLNSQTGSFQKPMSTGSKIDTARFSLPHASNWIEVGASAYKSGDNLKAEFSNYGKYVVDVFAPGFMINSTIPGSKYKEFDGTSMAAPVVSGIAAVILSYYPDLSPQDIRDIIMKSSVKVDVRVKNKNEKGDTLRVPFKELSVSGGVANLYNALKMAETYKK